MTNYDDIRFYEDDEVQDALKEYIRHPMIKGLLNYTFPNVAFEKIEEKVVKCNSIRDFQTEIIYHTVQKVLSKSSEGLSYSGFDLLKKDESYLYISNHRDIVLDTSLLNCVLYESDLRMTASAIGDNLVKKPFLLALSRLNRNFLVKRGISPREMLKSSQKLSEYIRKLLLEDKRSVWMAQREGRTKDGNDNTQQGVLKMLAMAKGDDSVAEYFTKLKIVPVSISYEFDPTDVLKLPEILAKRMEQIYIKSANEDFKSILKGALGNKGRIHISAGEPISAAALGEIEATAGSMNEQLQKITASIDSRVHQNYKLWPANYIAFDLLNGSSMFQEKYTSKQKRQFERRLTRRVNFKNALEVNSYLLMYANPVINQKNQHENQR
ncbi:1-acyl-sn-glycerol-3-phosphate acyltransferase [Salinimicrobium tongyeongense]|uniref:1-acyl-sn-glycerol-3-phosphate acyltransferase n=1 Tax=Salinimicrobium tongyeongense TaxID=2809707 RepID=A0ABY6NMP0_9FLAO|nr:1-acyl-sn-glycerol-3-phosphate acyltransferase [Salinimicrobium tongyeongense]UZH54069.1 1-acyl-sn-glycerol-3-phosphate acyltransferase [Salinimicrobium tongyeongense]